MSTVADIVNRCILLGDEQEWFEYKMGTALSDPDEIGQYISALSNAAVLADERLTFLDIKLPRSLPIVRFIIRPSAR